MADRLEQNKQTGDGSTIRCSTNISLPKPLRNTSAKCTSGTFTLELSCSVCFRWSVW